MKQMTLENQYLTRIYLIFPEKVWQVLRMGEIGFKIERGGQGGKPILNEFKIANFTKTLDLVPQKSFHIDKCFMLMIN